MERSDMGAACVKAILGKSPEWTLVKIAHPDEFTSTAVNSKQVPIPGPETFDQARCLSWVKSCPDGPEVRLPLYPRKRTQDGHRAMSEKCQKRKSSVFPIRSPRRLGPLPDWARSAHSGRPASRNESIILSDQSLSRVWQS